MGPVPTDSVAGSPVAGSRFTRDRRCLTNAASSQTPLSRMKVKFSMRDAYAASSSGADASASHHALLNQCRKSRTLSDPSSTIPRCLGSASANATSTVYLPRAEIIALFDDLGFVERAIREQYTCCLRDAYRCPFPDESDAWSVVIGFDDPRGIRRFYLHGFVRADGSIAASGKLEPKFFLDDDMVAYRPAPPL